MYASLAFVTLDINQGLCVTVSMGSIYKAFLGKMSMMLEKIMSLELEDGGINTLPTE